VNVVGSTAGGYHLNSILAPDPAKIFMEPIPYFVADERSSLCGGKDDVD